MAQPFTCECGIKTREPYLVNGEKMCVICADKIVPRLVSKRTVMNWKEFTASSHMVPTRPGYRARWHDYDED